MICSCRRLVRSISSGLRLIFSGGCLNRQVYSTEKCAYSSKVSPLLIKTVYYIYDFVYSVNSISCMKYITLNDTPCIQLQYVFISCSLDKTCEWLYFISIPVIWMGLLLEQRSGHQSSRIFFVYYIYRNISWSKMVIVWIEIKGKSHEYIDNTNTN